MAPDTGFQTPVNKIVMRGTPPVILIKTAETIADLYPGRLASRGTTDHDVAVCAAITPPVGWVGHEDTPDNYRKESYATIITAADDVAILSGGGFVIHAKMAPGFAAIIGDMVVPWGAGCVAPAAYICGLTCLRIPYSKNAAEADTNVNVPTGVLIHDVFVQSVVADASGTIDVGMGFGTESGFDADGLIDGLALAAVGWPSHNLVDANTALTNMGDLLDEVQIKDATGTPVFMNIATRPGYVCDGTLVSISYTTSNHAQSGYMWLAVSSPGIIEVGRCMETKTSTTAAVNLAVLSNL